jgi:hypothetical protein
MPTIQHTIDLQCPAETVWEAVRDVGALHERLVPGFVTATKMLAGASPPTRRVTFASGVVLDEVIVTIDDERRRLVWSIRGVEHHNGALLVTARPEGARVMWTADVLPADLAERFSQQMLIGLRCMKNHLDPSDQRYEVVQAHSTEGGPRAASGLG